MIRRVLLGIALIALLAASAAIGLVVAGWPQVTRTLGAHW